MFYRKIEGLEPVLYGYTDDKLRASIFQLYRPNLIEIKKDISRTEYNDVKDTLRNKEIIPHEFSTGKNHFNTTKVMQVATVEEVLNIVLHKEDIVLRELSKYVLPIEIFSDKVQKALRSIGYDEVLRYQEEVVVFPPDERKSTNFSFEIDELGLFVQLYGSTMQKVSK